MNVKHPFEVHCCLKSHSGDCDTEEDCKTFNVSIAYYQELCSLLVFTSSKYYSLCCHTVHLPCLSDYLPAIKTLAPFPAFT